MNLIVIYTYSFKFSQTSITPESFHTIYEWMIFSGSDNSKIIRRDNVLDLYCASQYLGIKGDT